MVQGSSRYSFYVIQLTTCDFPFYQRREIWFSENAPVALGDNTLFFDALSPPNDSGPYLKRYTTVLDLDASEEELFRKLKTRLQSYIRSAEGRGFKFEIIQAPGEVEKNEFLSSYRDHVKRKGLEDIDRFRVNALFQSEHFFLSRLTLDGKVIGMHTYLADQSRTRMLTSHSLDTDVDYKVIGLGNKWHHWKDILFFKARGLQHYDFGGILPDSDCGITRFKKSFGGRVEEQYQYERAKGLYRAYRRFRSRSSESERQVDL